MFSSRFSPRSPYSLMLSALVLLASCVEGPSVPGELDNNVVSGTLQIQPVFSLMGPGGSAVLSEAQAVALDEAFAQVNRFRIVVRRVSNSQVVVNRVIDVAPGQDAYDFSFDVSAGPNEQFSVTLTLLRVVGGVETELFQAGNVTVQATRPGQGQATTPTNIAVRYSGPDAEATSIDVTPSQLVLSPMGGGTLVSTVRDQSGAEIGAAFVSWTSTALGVATVSGGAVSGVADGLVQVTAATPGGLVAQAWVYVVDGVLAYVEGGSLKVRGAASGDVETRAAGAASAPAWSPDGGALYYAGADGVRDAAGGDALVRGSRPSVSFDGSKLAVERDGIVVFVNTDGTNETPGPEGTMPVWDGPGTLLVAGGSVERVRADGEGRGPVAGGGATSPARSDRGDIAYVDGGDLRVVGREAPVLSGVSGPASWSPSRTWLVAATGGGLSVVPADGSAPGAALPGLGGASDPAFKPTGDLTIPDEVNTTGFDPAVPSPGAKVRILGSNFDWIIPANNTVVWPTRAGPEASAVTAASETFVETVMPRTVVAGKVLVQTRTSSALRDFTPMLGSIEIVAETPGGRPVPGVVGVLSDAGGKELDRGTTDAGGSLLFPGLDPEGAYTVTVTAATGYVLKGDATYRFPALGAESALIELELVPVVHRIEVRPETPRVAVAATLEVELSAFDVTDAPITELASSRWLGGQPQVAATGTGLEGTITGLAPSAGEEGSVLAVELNGRVFDIPVTVTSRVSGTITQDPDPLPAGAPAVEPGGDGGDAPAVLTEPGRAYIVKVFEQGTDNLLGSAISDASGHYTLGDLLAGTYDVTLDEQRGRKPVPLAQTVTLDDAHPTGSADFLMSRAAVDDLSLTAGEAVIDAIDGTQKITVLAFDENGNELGGRPATFRSLDESVATVDDDGVVTAVDNGTVLIEVTVEAVKDTIAITVDQVAVEITILIPDEEEVEPAPPAAAARWDPFAAAVEEAPESGKALVGETEPSLPYEAKDAKGHVIDPSHKKPTWSSDNEAVMTASTNGDGTGNIDFLMVGDVTLTLQMDAAVDEIFVEVYLIHGDNLFITAGASSGNVMNPADVAAARIGRVDGNLDIASTSLTDLTGLQTIFEVGGSVLVRFNSALTNVAGLINVEEVGGDLVFEDNDALTTPPPGPLTSRLEYVDGTLFVLDNAMVTNLDVFANLRGLGGGLEIRDNPVFDDDDLLPGLEWVGGNIWLRDNDAFSGVNLLPGIVDVYGSLIIEGGGVVLGFPAIEQINGELQVGGESYNNYILEELYLPELTCLHDDFYVYGNAVLNTVSTPNLQFIGGGCTPPGAPLWRVQGDRSVDFSHRRELERRHGSVEQARAAAQSAVADRLRLQREESEARRTEDEAERARRAQAKRDDSGALRSVRNGLRASVLDGATVDRKSPRVIEHDRLLQATRERREQARASRRGAPVGAPMPEPNRTYGENPDLYVSDNPALASMDFTNLLVVEGYLEFDFNDVLASITFPALDFVGSFLRLYNTDLTSASFPSLNQVGMDLDLQQNDAGLTFSAPELQEIWGALRASFNDDLGDLILPSLVEAYYGVDLYSNHWNSSLALPALEHTLGDINIQYNVWLSDIVIASESELDVECSVYIYENEGLANIDMPGLGSVGFGGFECGQSLYIQSNYGLRTVSLASGTGLSVAWNLFVQHNTSNPGEYGDPPVLLEDPTWTLAIPGLADVGGYVDVNDNVGLVAITMSSGNPATITGSFVVEYNDELISIEAPGLQSVGEYFEVGWNGELDIFDFTGLEQVGGDLEVKNNGNPESFIADFQTLTTVGGDVDIVGNAGLEELYMNALTSVGGEFYVTSNGDLHTMTADALVTVNGNVSVSYNNPLTSFSMSSLAQLVGGAVPVGPMGVSPGYAVLYIVESDALTGFDLSSLSGVGGVFVLSNDAMTTLGALGPLDGSTIIEISDHIGLENLNGLSSVTGTLARVEITSNSALTNVDGLSNVGSTAAGDPVIGGDFLFDANDALPCSAVPALFTTLEDRHGGAAVGGTFQHTSASCLPTVTDVSPSTVTAGVATGLTITGTNLYHASGVSVCFVAFVNDATRVVSADGTTVTITVTWDLSETGSRCVNVHTPQGDASGSVTLIPPTALVGTGPPATKEE